nr:DEAD-box ATP-dependent RNA helicase 42 [Ciona intestinalis]|eukprot:XP_026696660.1 DEAD-box ATP-dependent RNA helicase 42 [Ciona intestinalis]
MQSKGGTYKTNSEVRQSTKHRESESHHRHKDKYEKKKMKPEREKTARTDETHRHRRDEQNYDSYGQTNDITSKKEKSRHKERTRTRTEERKHKREKRNSFDLGKNEKNKKDKEKITQTRSKSADSAADFSQTEQREPKNETFTVQKVFTSDEIAQMSRRKKRHEKNLPISAIRNGELSSATVMEQPKEEVYRKSGTWHPIIGEFPDRNYENNVSSSSSRFSTKLMNLKEEKGRKPLKKKEIADIQKREDKISEKRSTTSTRHGKEKDKTQQREYEHNSPSKQPPSPLRVKNTLENSTKYLDIGDSGSDKNGKPRVVEVDARTQHPAGEVVFRINMDDVENNTKPDGFSSALSKKWRRTKSWVKRAGLMERKETRETQVAAVDVPNLLVDGSTQCGGLMESKETQTLIEHTTSETQTSALSKSRSSQTKVKTKDQDIQTMAEMMSLGTQTEDEDHPVWGGSHVSLDRLVRCKGMRRRATTSKRKDDDSLDKSIFKRSATLPNKLQVIEEESVKELRAYNWTQTDRFIKLNISHSGAHLLPSNKIKIQTNGANLKLTIDTSSNSNKQQQQQRYHTANTQTLHS